MGSPCSCRTAPCSSTTSFRYGASNAKSPAGKPASSRLRLPVWERSNCTHVPLIAELDTASKCTALRPRARSRRRHWYATSVELVCAVSDKDAADGRLEQILSPQRLNRRRRIIDPSQCAELRKVP